MFIPGALGTEIAYLLRRLKARIEAETGQKPQLHCYATSATIGSEGDMPKVAEFASDLFGEPFSNDPDDLDVITSEKDRSQDALDSEPWGKLAIEAWTQLQELLWDRESVSVNAIRSLLKRYEVPESVLGRMDEEDVLLGLGKVLLGEESTAKLVLRCRNLLDMTDSSSIKEIGIEGLNDEEDGKTLSAMVEVLSSAQRSDGIPILSSRYHSFLRAPEGIFLNLHTRKLTPHKTISEAYGDSGSTPVYEVSVCRHCGQFYVLGTQKSDSEAGTAWLNPKHEGTDADDEFIPRKYYRVLAEVEEQDSDEEVQWLCPICGSLHHEEGHGAHRFAHESVERVPVALNEVEGKQADEETARCRHCGYQSRIAIQPMRISPEAAGSVVCYDLVREIPPFEDYGEPDEDDWFSDADFERKRAGSVICFSDKRQDAAFFAPAMDRTYGNITRRQLIREAVDANGGEDGCTPETAINWMLSVADRRYPNLFGSDKKNQATAWILDELAAEDSRNSLEGLGVIRVEPTDFDRGLEDSKIRSVIRKWCIDRLPYTWLSEDDFVVFAKVCLESLRERNVIEVPAGADQMRSNHEQRGNFVVLGCEDAKKSEKDVVQFAGTSTSSIENKRSAFVRKYAKKMHGVELSREDSIKLLQSLFTFMAQYLSHLEKGYLVGDKQKFRLSKDLWRLYPHSDDDVVYLCDVCGCETHLDTNGVCITSKCDGTVRRMTFAEARNKDRYYKVIYQEEALPLSIEEHTAQLSSKKAREIQSEFIKGEVNVLSCTTTFELGVDVGDLRAIFMRNVPPSTANYTQRAGRVGRRAGMPGYAITFARLRPHDIAYFEDPTKIISGITRVPMCYLDNKAIAIRHVFAVAMSEFFRVERAKDYSRLYNDFMALAKEEPCGLSELRDFLDSKPERVLQQITRIIPEDLTISQELGIRDWGWTGALVARPSDQNDDGGRLVRAHALKHADYARVREGVERYRDKEKIKASSLMRSLGTLEKDLTISVLAENGILPKYGFPTDLVELHLPEEERSLEENRLSLSRGMRQAIREYAPGAEIVAGKALWRSRGVRKLKGHDLQERRYGQCPQCRTFVWPIENYSSDGTCPVCKTEFHLDNTMLIPSYGFEGKRVEKGIGLRKPRSRGYAKVHFSQHWPGETKQDHVPFAGGLVLKRYAGNGQLCVLNEPRFGFQVCSYCNAAAVGDGEIDHWGYCGKRKNPYIRGYNALGTAFVSDVLELAFRSDSHLYGKIEDWEAVMWALFTAAAQILEVPETELGGTIYRNETEDVSVMIYDDVPGGAGHARQLNDQVKELVERAYVVVDGHCGCGEDSCCYGCIANYYNQVEQSKLSRGIAKRILGSLLGHQEGDCGGK